jgi:chromate reductase, NAD(P)H dehydrogenase (quinone)
VKKKNKILAIIGSTRADSSNLRLVKKLEELTAEIFEFTIFEKLSELPHFNPDLDNENPPGRVVEFRQQIIDTDAVIICTPEYVFSLPGSLKNAIEWCVSTTIFSQKPVGLITASASGDKGHEELQLVMRTIETRFSADTTLLIKGIKGKFDQQGNLTDKETIDRLNIFIGAFERQINEYKHHQPILVAAKLAGWSNEHFPSGAGL